VTDVSVTALHDNRASTREIHSTDLFDFLAHADRQFTVGCHGFSPSPCEISSLVQNLSRQDAKAQRKKSFILGAWRALCPFGDAQDMLCASHVFRFGISKF
jgi:hypothetical protein